MADQIDVRDGGHMAVASGPVVEEDAAGTTARLVLLNVWRGSAGVEVRLTREEAAKLISALAERIAFERVEVIAAAPPVVCKGCGRLWKRALDGGCHYCDWGHK